MGLGALHTVSLAEAREAALGCRKLLLEGIDPIEARNARRGALRAANARQVTFRQCAEKYIAGHKAGWRSARHAEQWPTSLEKFVYPFLGNLPVDKIETAHIMKVLEPIWTVKPETASRVRGRIELVFGLGNDARLSQRREPGPLERSPAQLAPRASEDCGGRAPPCPAIPIAHHSSRNCARRKALVPVRLSSASLALRGRVKCWGRNGLKLILPLACGPFRQPA